MKFDVNNPARYDEVEATITATDEDVLDLCIEAATRSRHEADSARDTLEGKASNLIGFAGILTGLLAAGVALEVPTAPADASKWIAALYPASLATLALGAILVGSSIAHALACLRVGNQKWVHLDAYTPIEIQSMKRVNAKRALLTDLVYASGQNHKATHRKADRVRSSQTALTFALAAILVSGLLQIALLWLTSSPGPNT